MSRQPTIDTFFRPELAHTPLNRSISRESTLSCITVQNELPSMSADESGLASTPPTSVDGASHSGESKQQERASSAVEQAAEQREESNGRSRRSNRTSVATYNENALSRSTRFNIVTKLASQRDLSDKMLTGDLDGTPDQLVQDSIQVLDLDWRVEALPGEQMELGIGDSAKTGTSKNVKSTGSNRGKSFLKRAGSIIDKSKTVLGKRTRDLLEAGKAGAKGAARRSSLRTPQNSVQQAASDEPEAKKRRVSEPATKANRTSMQEKDEIHILDDEITRKPVARPRSKIWLAQGLYVGQEQDFDPRFNPGQKSKRQEKGVGGRNRRSGEEQEEQPAKKRTILPLPMFAGKRLLENGRDFKMPFDVFNPLPPGQPKPDEWRKTQRNVFVGDAAEYWKVNKKLEYSTCICTPESGCDEDCFNRFMFYECDKNNCNIGPEYCTNRNFEDLRKRHKAGGKYRVGVEVMKTVNKGYGVRSCRSFAPGQIIVEYTGEIITQDECDHRMRTMYKSNECFYLMMFDQNMIIDATRGSIARFVNHSCEPNCRMVKWTVDGKPRMALFAGDGGITTGEELTYDYNFDPFSAKNIQECHCGMPSCRGVLGPRPKNEREPKDALTPLLQQGKRPGAAGAKRKIQEVIEKSVAGAKSKKRRLSADVGALLKSKSKSKSSKENRAERAALRAGIKGAKSKRVVAKLTKKAVAMQSASSAAARKTAAKTAATKKGVKSLVSARSQPDGKVTVKVSKRAVTLPKGTTARSSKGAVKSAASVKKGSVKGTVKSNVVRTVKGAKAGASRTIKVVDVYDVPDE